MVKVKTSPSRGTSVTSTPSSNRTPASQGASETFSSSGIKSADGSHEVAKAFPVLSTAAIFLNEYQRQPYEQQLARSHLLLDQLEKLRFNIIEGEIPKKEIELLEKALAAHQSFPSHDPDLNEIILEIETRVRVELAKYKQNK